MAQFQLVPAEISDVDDMSALFYEAFEKDIIFQHLEANVEPGLKHREFADYLRQQFEQSHLTNANFFKVIDASTGKMAAYALWRFPISLSETQTEERDALSKIADQKGFLPGANVPLCEDFWGQVFAFRKKYWNPETDYFLELLAARPSYHRRGLGTSLLFPGLSRADAAGSKTYIEASVMGRPLYVKHGWEVIDFITIDWAKHKLGEGLYKHPTLMRAPREKGEELVDEKEAKEIAGVAN